MVAETGPWHYARRQFLHLAAGAAALPIASRIVASAGNGTPTHVAGELFKMMTGVGTVHVPYRGGAPALTDLLGGQVQVMFDNMSSSIGYSGLASSAR